MKKFAYIMCFVLFASYAFAAPMGPIKEVYAEKGMVSSAHDLASKAGVEIMKKGGNAVDAAVATALALHVVEPYNIGLGGGGFMLIRLAKTGEVIFLDYREKAPLSSTKDMFASSQAKNEKWSSMGGKASGVPGVLKGMWYALEKYGTMSFAEVAEPAIRLAEGGFVLREGQRPQIAESLTKLLVYNDAKDLPFVTPDGKAILPGQIMRMPKLANTLRLIATEGPSVFYEGPIGQAVVDAVNNAGGNMSMEDLKNYTIEVRKPVEGTYRGFKIYSAAPASSGGTHIVQILNILENFDIAKMKPDSIDFLNIYGQSMRMAFADRSAYMADTAFAKVPLAGLTSKAYAKTLAAKIDPKGKLPAQGTAGDPWPFDGKKVAEYKAGMGREHISTTHFSVVDAQGNIVATTNTINDWYGSGVIVPEYQFMLNDQMDDFASDPTSVNAPEPGKRMLSSMSPTIILDSKGKPFMTLGASGAMRILTAVTQVIVNVIDFKMNMDEAIQQPRLWVGASGKGRIDAVYGADVVKKLEALDYNLDLTTPSTTTGICQGIMINKGKLNGGAETNRSSGLPVGY